MTSGTAPESTEVVVTAAQAAAAPLRALTREQRGDLCIAIADALDADGDAIVAAAVDESHLPEAALRAELGRTSYQWRFFADVVREGSYLEAAIDHAGDTPMGPRPDLRRMLVPVGPVAVFGASNFPLAFSTAGGDTASALAVGCPVVVKVHPSHPRTSALVAEAVRRALSACDAPAGSFGVVEGMEAGVDLVRHPAIQAVAFTGSLAGGQALIDHIATRSTPIPFYGELSSINPVVVTAAAAAERTEEIATGLVGSYTARNGQICTKPGLVLVPSGPAGDRLVTAAAEATTRVAASTLLNPGIQQAYVERTEGYADDERVAVLARGVESGAQATPTLVETTALTVATNPDLAHECFGPTTVLVRYDDAADIGTLVSTLDGSLTATVHSGDGEDVSAVLDVLTPLAGRIIFGGYPTGVAVAWAQHHGGPWPSTNSLHTSVGATSARRFLRPVAWQDAPQGALPPELRDGAGEANVPRRVDGVLTLP